MGIANITNNILTDSGILTSSLQSSITLTTNGSVGVSTFSGNVLNIPNYNNITDGVISGGVVTWSGTGLVFNISACNYYINGVNYSSAVDSKTLATADPTNDRIDVFAVNTSGQVVVITGTPATNPQKPQVDPATQLELTTVNVAAGATTPTGVTAQIVYDENVETNWTKTNSLFSSVNYAYTTAPYVGTYSIQGVCGGTLNQLLFTCVPSLDYSSYSTIKFAVKLTRALYTTYPEYIYIEFTTTGGVRVGNLLRLDSTNQYGFNYTSTSWQLITVPLSQLNITTGAIGAIRVMVQQGQLNAGFTFQTIYFDRIELQGGISQSTTTSNSFGKVTAGTGNAIATIPTDTLNVVATGLASVIATAKTLTIAVPLTLTTTGSSGAATLTGNTLNIPQYGGGGGMAIGGSITSATAGSVLFAGTSGVLQQDNTNFFWDDTNNILGIGTNTPKTYSKLTVNGQIVADSNICLNYGQSVRMNMYYNPSPSSDMAMTTGYSADFVLDAAGGNWKIRTTTSSTAANATITTLTDRLTISALGVATFTGQIRCTLTNSTTDGGGQIYLNGATGNRIDFNTNGNGAPTFTTRSAGTKIVLYPGPVTASTVDLALGIESGAMWFSVVNSSNSFKWYAGITNIMSLSGTGVLTLTAGIVYKRLNPTTTTLTSTATLTPDISVGDFFTITAQAVGLSVANPTGTPVEGQKMTIRIEDNGTAQAITWSGTQFRASTDLTLPTSTTATKTIYLGFLYNSTDTKWDLVSKINNF